MDSTKVAVSKNLPLFAVLCLLMLIAAFPNFEAYLGEDRWYRDARGLTPFDQVSVSQSDIVDGGIVVQGAMRKVRCDVDGPSIVAYVYFDDKPRRRTAVDTSPEDAITGVIGQSRPPSESLEHWGPWFIAWRGATPDRWEIFVTHENCPTPPHDQTNLFASGPWADVAPETTP